MSTSTFNPPVENNIKGVTPNFPTMMPSMVSVVRIVSISPIERVKQMPLGTHLYTFKIDAQPRDGYQILTVADTYQLIPTGYDDLSDTNPTPTLAPAPIKASILADSLVNEWNRTIAPVGSLGCAVLPNDMMEGTPAFEALLRTLNAQVAQLAEWAIRDAADKHHNGQSKYISDGFHRSLAKWMFGDQARALPWFNMQTVDKMKNCLKCGESIKAQAKGCKHCGCDLVEYYSKYKDGFTPEDDPIVAAIVDRMNAPKQTKGTAKEATVEKVVVKANVGTVLPNEARAMIVAALNGEQKTEMNLKKTQDARDQFLIDLIPELCLKNKPLAEALLAKGYVVSNAE